jgi:glycosyltransferase involved in cell wall biosynthesis
MTVSILILARNEEANLAQCLASVAWSDDIVVLDDNSTDGTAEIARRAGVRLIRHSAGGEREQRTYSLREISFKHPWVYNPDADEVTPHDLRDEIMKTAADPARYEVAYRVRFKNMFLGKWIRRSSLYPTWVMRLFRPEKISFERRINLTYCAEGPVGFLRAHFLHYPFTKGLDSWIEKHNRYSRLEAEEGLEIMNTSDLRWKELFDRDPIARRRALKELFFRLPARPALRFVYAYILRAGFLDGTQGLTYCRLMAMYESMISIKMAELRRSARKISM